MHPDELPIDAALVRTLLADQFPEYARLPLDEVRSSGTVNAIYRLGDELCVRLARVSKWTTDLEKEWHWLRPLAAHLTLHIPGPVGRGRPIADFPHPWSIYRWLPGAPYTDALITDEVCAATDLAGFVRELRSVPITGDAPTAGRSPLVDLDVAIREALVASTDLIDAASALGIWACAVDGPPWHGTPTWIHGDLLRPNLLVRDGRLAAVIDFGEAGVGDPANDIVAAWSVFGSAGRSRYRELLAVDDETWLRAKGFALAQAAMIIPYYRRTNPEFVTQAVRTVEQIVSDTG